MKSGSGRFDFAECHDAILSFDKGDRLVRTWFDALTIDNGEVSANWPCVLFRVPVLVFRSRHSLPPRSTLLVSPPCDALNLEYYSLLDQMLAATHRHDKSREAVHSMLNK